MTLSDKIYTINLFLENSKGLKPNVKRFLYELSHSYITYPYRRYSRYQINYYGDISSILNKLGVSFRTGCNLSIAPRKGLSGWFISLN